MEKLKDLWDSYENVLNSQNFIEKDLDYSVLDNHIPYLEKIDQLSNSAVMIFDLFRRKHVYISDNTFRIFKLDKEKASKDHSYIDKRIHPDDLPLLTEAGIYFLKYAFTVSPEIRKKGKLVNEYRILNEENRYIRIIEQQMCLEMDKHDNVWLALGIMDISPDQSEESVFKSRLIDFSKGEVYAFPPNEKPEVFLTAREKEILKLIAKGHISKEIADKLFISVNTVNTHRQRILQKLNAENSIEALRYAERTGLI